MIFFCYIIIFVYIIMLYRLSYMFTLEVLYDIGGGRIGFSSNGCKWS